MLDDYFQSIPIEAKNHAISGKMLDLTNWISKQNDQSTQEIVELFGSAANLAIKLTRKHHRFNYQEETPKEETQKEANTCSKSVFENYEVENQMSFADFPELYP